MRIESFESLLDIAVWHLEPISGAVQLSDRTHELIGSPSAQVCEVSELMRCIAEEDLELFAAEIADLAQSREPRSVRIRLKQNPLLWYDCRFGYLEKPLGRFTVLAAFVQAKESSSSADLRRLACFDSLTGLPNRLLFREQLALSVKASQKDSSVTALLSIELGDLRRIADAYSRVVSDDIIKVAVQRLVTCVRSADSVLGGDPFAKQGGLSRLENERFAVVLSNLRDPQDAARVAKRMIDALALPIHTDEVEAYPPIWIGIALAPWDSVDAEQLVQCASLALDHARRGGVSRALFYNRNMNRLATDKLSIETGLRKALDRREFVLFYQQRVHGKTGEVLGHEALIRWNQPGKGITAPGLFMDVAEKSRLIVPMGTWVLEEACMQNAEWIREGLPAIPVAVNVSAVQFGAQGFVTSVKRALELSGLAPDMLELEITESVVMGDVKHVIERLREIKKLGCLVAIDDFGTGFSSLSYLRDFPADYLKIDRSFVNAACKDKKSAAISHAIVDLGNRLEMGVIAEGVETVDQVLLLISQGVTLFQGFYFSRPQPANVATVHWQQRLANPGIVLRDSELLTHIESLVAAVG
jgi:diguanylate cyclase (GGDEF)-like protein